MLSSVRIPLLIESESRGLPSVTIPMVSPERNLGGLIAILYPLPIHSIQSLTKSVYESAPIRVIGKTEIKEAVYLQAPVNCFF